MKIYKYQGKTEKLLYQNAAHILQTIEGVLLDTMLLRTKRGYMILKETYVNCYTSNYTVYFSTTPETIFDKWNNLSQEGNA